MNYLNILKFSLLAAVCSSYSMGGENQSKISHQKVIGSLSEEEKQRLTKHLQAIENLRIVKIFDEKAKSLKKKAHKIPILGKIPGVSELIIGVISLVQGGGRIISAWNRHEDSKQVVRSVDEQLIRGMNDAYVEMERLLNKLQKITGVNLEIGEKDSLIHKVS